MKFTSYYSKVVKSQGVPHLSVKQHQYLMNILHIEAGLHHLELLQCEGPSSANKNRAIFNLKNKLESLTKKQAPETILQDMVEQSE
jgi:hypothetical protein